MEVSIIVPVYNAKKYLYRCILSIWKQSFQDMEIILVDDGSNDGSGLLCDQLAQRDSRIKVIHRKNQGQSKARNDGIAMASGTYICFVDADDRLKKYGVETLLFWAKKENYDVVSGLYERVSEKKKSCPIKYNWTEGPIARHGSREERKRYQQYKTSSCFGYVWGKLYKRSFLLEHNLWFDDIRKIFMEDSCFNLKLMAFEPRYYLILEPVYLYYIYKSSSSNKKTYIDEKIRNLWRQYAAFLKQEDKYEENLDLFIPLIARTFCWSLIKNVPFEGISLKKIKRRIHRFETDPVLKEIVNVPQLFHYLFSVPKGLEKAFYGFCFFCLKHHWDFLMAAIFVIMYPGMRLYILLILKR